MSDTDIVVVGAGMVGSMLAAAAGRAGLNVVLLENRMPAPFDPASAYDLRVSALSLASENMLKAVGAWQGILDRRSAPFRRMKVWDGEQGGTTLFDSQDLDYSHLGTIVENRVIQLALHDQLRDMANVSLRDSAAVKDFDVTPSEVRVVLDDGQTLTAKLLVGADGANSTVRSLAGIDSRSIRYPQKALVASVDTADGQQDITWQRFLPTGPQAFLPLQGSRASMVWYHSEDEVARLLALDDATFLDEMHASFPVEPGAFTGLSARSSFPLFATQAERYVLQRVALIGDAAHSVHPLAGQGVNLGLLDAAQLCADIERSAERGRDFGELRTLRRYERARRSENEIMIRVLDGFYHAFKPQMSAVQAVRSSMLDAVERVNPLRRLIMQQAMGVRGDLPPLALSDHG